MTMHHRPPRAARALSLLLALAIASGIGVATAAPAVAETIGTGAVSIKGPGSELVPGTTVEIRSGTCDGAAVWRTTTGSTPSAYGAFGIGLAPGRYCILTLSAPSPYSPAANVVFDMEARPANWVTVWLPGPAPAPAAVSGALVAKDAEGAGVNSVTALIQEGSCGATGRSVWQNTTASNRWSSGGFGISLTPGTYCASALYVPAGYAYPAPTTVTVTAPGPAWITLWLARVPFTGTGDSVVAIDAYSGEKVLSFSCPACTGNLVVWGFVDGEREELLVNSIGPYSGRQIIGFLDYDRLRYSSLEIDATGTWSFEVLSGSSIRSVGSSATGSGDDVVSFRASGTAANISHNGSGYFGVWSKDRFGEFDLLANEIGDYYGTSALRSPSLVQVYSEGSWSISIG